MMIDGKRCSLIAFDSSTVCASTQVAGIEGIAVRGEAGTDLGAPVRDRRR